MVQPRGFVDRQRELAQLNRFLDRALAGRGQICLVTGDAGAGKTTLATEFMRQAQAQQPDLVAAAAMGDPQTGASDPYLIFREVLARLTGDVETQLAQGTITREGAKRLQGALRTSIDCLVEFGPDLIGLLVPGAGLAVQLAKIGIETGKRAGLLERMTQAPPEDRTRSVGPRSIDQGQIYEQYAKVLNALSQHAPLLLILDDLQWADNASIDLLFHLTRRIECSRIFIIAMLRSAEIALGRAGDRHPLERVMSEVKRYYGDVAIDLDEAARSEGVVFGDALLDSEPNALGSGFRRALLARTGGNPLFAVELLREMEEQGDLRHDALGRWIAAPGLDWSTLPACGGAELAGRNLAGARMVGVDFAGANLYGARLAGARLTATTLVSATLAAADLSLANLRGADLREANLRGVNLAGADLTSADLRGAAVSGATLTNTDLTDADLTRANLAAAHLEGAILTGVHFDGSTRWPHGFSPRQTD